MKLYISFVSYHKYAQISSSTWESNITNLLPSQCQVNLATINLILTFSNIFIFLFALLKLHFMINTVRHEGKWQNILYFCVIVTFLSSFNFIVTRFI